MSALEHLQRSIEQLLAREQIRDLVHRYGIAVDDRDMVALADCFAPEGRFEHVDGSLTLDGRAAVLDYYGQRLKFIGPSYHYPHSHLVTLDGADTAHGVVTAHAELAFPDGDTYWVALRYFDRYRRDDGAWRFVERRVAFLYYVPLADLPRAFTTTLRKRAAAPHRAADWPEGLATWQAYKANDDGAPATAAAARSATDT